MKEKINQMFKDKLFLVMLVLGLLTIVAAAGVVTIQRKDGLPENPYMDLEEQGQMIAEEPEAGMAGESNAQELAGVEEENRDALPDTLAEEYANTAEESGASEYSPAVEYADAGNASGSEQNLDTEEVGAGMDAARALVLDFTHESKMAWPVRGNIVLDYSMDSTIYFPTLDQYKCNPGLVIQGAVSDPVCAPANARVMESGINEEIGNYLVLDFGNSYTAVCGQLKEVTVSEGEYLEKGQLLGYVAEPTKYYTIEGSNVFLQLKHEDQSIDPLDYLE
ncbi:MAG: M23 family metallopeptidase [Lachnospiraceae bacterium]|nr:M23 family metallopeptidase [Lachnospiraceae bacterium]